MSPAPPPDAAMAAKLALLADIAGYHSPAELIAAVADQDWLPGICTSPSCEYAPDVDPDEAAGDCEACDASTVQSALVLATRIGLRPAAAPTASSDQ